MYYFKKMDTTDTTMLYAEWEYEWVIHILYVVVGVLVLLVPDFFGFNWLPMVAAQDVEPTANGNGNGNNLPDASGAAGHDMQDAYWTIATSGPECDVTFPHIVPSMPLPADGILQPYVSYEIPDREAFEARLPDWAKPNNDQSSCSSYNPTDSEDDEPKSQLPCNNCPLQHQPNRPPTPNPGRQGPRRRSRKRIPAHKYRKGNIVHPVHLPYNPDTDHPINFSSHSITYDPELHDDKFNPYILKTAAGSWSKEDTCPRYLGCKGFEIHGWPVPEQQHVRTSFNSGMTTVNYLNVQRVLMYLTRIDFTHGYHKRYEEFSASMWKEEQQIPVIISIAKQVLPDHLPYFRILEQLIKWFMKDLMTSLQIFDVIVDLRYITQCVGYLRYPLEEELVFVILYHLARQQHDKGNFRWMEYTLVKMMGLQPTEFRNIIIRCKDLAQHKCFCSMHITWPIHGNISRPIVMSYGSVYRYMVLINQKVQSDVMAVFDSYYINKVSWTLKMFAYGFPLHPDSSLTQEENITHCPTFPKHRGFDKVTFDWLTKIVTDQHRYWDKKKIAQCMDWLNIFKQQICNCHVHCFLRGEDTSHSDCLTLPIRFSNLEKEQVDQTYWIRLYCTHEGAGSYREGFVHSEEYVTEKIPMITELFHKADEMVLTYIPEQSFEYYGNILKVLMDPISEYATSDYDSISSSDEGMPPLSDLFDEGTSGTGTVDTEVE